MKLTHGALWAAIDALARSKGLSASGLAIKAGLDATAFNRSKRIGPDGRERWPSMESIAKVLSAADCDLTTFARILEARGAPPQFAIPSLPLARAVEPNLFDADGRPLLTSAWDATPFPGAVESLYALDVGGDRYAPYYRDGDVVLVAPGRSPRRGDKVVVKPIDEAPFLALFHRRTATRIELTAMAATDPRTDLGLSELEWIARIVWASQ